MSDFDPEDVVSEQAPISDFDPEDIVNEPTIQMEPQEEAPITVSGVPIVEPVAGYAVGRAAQEGISKTGELAGKAADWVATNVGQTSPEQLKLIKENFKTFTAMDPMARVNSFLDKSRKTNLSVNEMYAEAEKLLVDKAITPDEYKGIVERAALEQDKYGRPTFARPVSQSEISKTIDPALESTKKIIKTKEEKLLEELANLKAKEAVALESQKSLGQLPKETAEQITKTTKERVLQNPQAFDFNIEPYPIFQEEQRKLISAKDTPLTEIFPSLKGTSIDPGEADVFKKILKIPETADITGDKLQEYMRTARSSAFLKDGELSSKPSAAFATETRKKISELSPEAGKLMEAENVELGKLESLENAGYIKREGAGLKTTVEMTDTQRNKLVKDLATSYKGSTPTDVAENLQVLKNYLSPDQFKKLELATIKLAEQNAGDIDYFPSSILNKIFGSLKIRKVSRGLATLPQSIALNLPKTAAVGKFAMKALPFVGAGLGGVAAQAAEEAIDSTTSGALPTTISTDVQGQPFSPFYEERGFTPEEAVKRAEVSKFQEEYGTQPKTIQQEYPSNLALEGMSDIVESPQITSQRKSLQKQQQMLEESRRLRNERRIETQKVKQLGALAPTYVEAPLKQVLKADNPSEIASIAQSMQASTDKASQEYSRVLSQIVDAPVSQKEAVLFGLNQQPAFRELLRKLKDKKETEEEVPLMLKGPA